MSGSTLPLVLQTSDGRAALTPQIVFQVVLDATRSAHSVSGNDNGRPRGFVYSYGILRTARVDELRKIEGIVAVF